MAIQNSQPLAAASTAASLPGPDPATAPPYSQQGAIGSAVALEQVGPVAPPPPTQGARGFGMAQVGPAAALPYRHGAPVFAIAPQQVGSAADPPPHHGASGLAVVPQQGAAPMSPEGPPGFCLPPHGHGQQHFAPVMMPGNQQVPPMPVQGASMGVGGPMPLQAPAMATTLQPYQGAAPPPPPLSMGIPHLMEMQQAQGGHMIAPPPLPLGPPPMMMQQQPPQANTLVVEQPPQPFGYPPMMLMQLQHPPQVGPVVMDQPPQPFGHPPFIQQQPPQADPMMMPQPYLSAPPCKRQRFEQNDMTYGQHMASHQQDGPFLQNGLPCPPPNASSTLFIESLPNDCITREVAHIFRQYMGFREVRLVKRAVTREPMCFVDFDTPGQAFLAMESLQGYKFDQQDHHSLELRLEFSRSSRVTPYGGC
ncbi:hypothetical protein QOZ80_6AG0528800 [Eleusine coracana subsp. coracana]|nr:hypothetical protein QOZ80_6AG0528800 [Eleusine coracana subsp. coracana]